MSSTNHAQAKVSGDKPSKTSPKTSGTSSNPAIIVAVKTARPQLSILKPTTPKPAPEAWIPLDRYEDLKALVHGAEAQTSITKSLTTGQTFVVKRYWVVRKGKKNDPPPPTPPPINEAFILLECLRPHPNILRAFGFDNTPRRRHLYTEFCDGGDLADLARQCAKEGTTCPEHVTLHVFVSLTHALAYLHRGLRWQPAAKTWEVEQDFSNKAGYIHGDIKPANVFVRWTREAEARGYPDVVLGDFGATQRADRFYGASGTVGFMAPEVEAAFDSEDEDEDEYVGDGRGYMTLATDYFSLGQTVHYLATNRKHVVGADPETLPVVDTEEGMIGVRLGSEPVYETVALIEAVKACLNPDSELRPTFVGGWSNLL